MTPLPTALLISRDLFFTSKVTGSADAIGVRVEVVPDTEMAISRLSQGDYRCLFVDLADAALDIGTLMSAAIEPRPPVIAFGAHVATGKLQAAEAAGCDEVLSRGKFSANLPEILRRYVLQSA